MQENNGSETLQFNKNLHDIFQNILKISISLNVECFISGYIIQELLLKSKGYNPSRFIECVFQCEKTNLDSLVSSFFINSAKISDNLYSFDGHILIFYFIPAFSPYNINTDNGFTIDQIYYYIKNNTVIDTSGKGIEHLTSKNITIKTTAQYEKWNKNLFMGFINRMGFYYDAKIEQDDYEKLSKLSIERPNIISHLLWMNRPGTAIKTFINLCPQAKSWIFDTILKLCGHYKINIKDNIKPSQIFSDEKMKLIDLYGDFFINSATKEEKNERIQTLIKLLC